MTDYDPRDFGYEGTYLGKGYYVREAYMLEAGGYVWQPLQTVKHTPVTPEPFTTKEAAEGWLRGFRDALKITEEEG